MVAEFAGPIRTVFVRRFFPTRCLGRFELFLSLCCFSVACGFCPAFPGEFSLRILSNSVDIALDIKAFFIEHGLCVGTSINFHKAFVIKSHNKCKKH